MTPTAITVASRKRAYHLQADLGFRTTIAGARSSKESVARYLSQLDTADRQEPSDVLVLKTARLKGTLDKLKDEMGNLAA